MANSSWPVLSRIRSTAQYSCSRATPPRSLKGLPETTLTYRMGAVKRWYVREWTTVAGDVAAMPIRPTAVGASKEKLSDFPKSAQKENAMILRMWTGRSTAERASEYVQHATRKVFPALRAIEGHRGAYLLRRAVDGAIEFVVLTLWDSMAAVRRLAGAEPQKAVVGPEAKVLLNVRPAMASSLTALQRSERLIVIHQRSRSQVPTAAIARGVEALDVEQFVGELARTK